MIISVWENDPKLKETPVNNFELRHHRSTEEYASENSELVTQYAKIVWVSLKSSLEIALYGFLLHRFIPNVSTSSDKRRKLKRKVI